MTQADFNSLQYGNTIRDLGTGQIFLITFVDRDAQGNTKHVGYEPAIDINAAAGFTIVSKNVGQTFLAGNNKGQLVLMGQTIQGPPVPPTAKKK